MSDQSDQLEQSFVEYIVKNLVDNPDSVSIVRTVDDRGVLLTLSVDPTDMGKLIGKAGATAKAIRTLLRVIGAKSDERLNLKIVEPEGYETNASPDEVAAAEGTDAETQIATEPQAHEEPAVSTTPDTPAPSDTVDEPPVVEKPQLDEAVTAPPPATPEPGATVEPSAESKAEHAAETPVHEAAAGTSHTPNAPATATVTEAAPPSAATSDAATKARAGMEGLDDLQI